MDTSKSKLQITNGKPSKVKLGASTSSTGPKAWAAPKKNYAKKKPAEDFGISNFGLGGISDEAK